MISSVSGGSALALLSVFGRPSATQAAEAPPTAQRPTAPPPPPPGGNGADAQSLFGALLSDSGETLDSLMAQLIDDLDQDGDGALNASELTAAFQPSDASPKPRPKPLT